MQLRSGCSWLGSPADLRAKPIMAVDWAQCAITVICACLDKGLSAWVPPVCRRAFCNIGRGLWECLQGCTPQFNSMCSAISQLSSLPNQLPRAVEPVLLTHVTPIVSICFYRMDQKHLKTSVIFMATCWTFKPCTVWSPRFSISHVIESHGAERAGHEVCFWNRNSFKAQWKYDFFSDFALEQAFVWPLMAN